MEKKLWAILVFLFCAVAYVIFAPFEPISFFSLLAFAIVGEVWVVRWLWRKHREKTQND